MNYNNGKNDKTGKTQCICPPEITHKWGFLLPDL
jgi:hypothetical protein